MGARRVANHFMMRQSWGGWTTDYKSWFEHYHKVTKSKVAKKAKRIKNRMLIQEATS